MSNSFYGIAAADIARSLAAEVLQDTALHELLVDGRAWKAWKESGAGNGRMTNHTPD